MSNDAINYRDQYDRQAAQALIAHGAIELTIIF